MILLSERRGLIVFGLSVINVVKKDVSNGIDFVVKLFFNKVLLVYF